MSLSARAGFARENGSKAARVWCGMLDKFDHHHASEEFTIDMDHCTIAISDYMKRKHMVVGEDNAD